MCRYHRAIFDTPRIQSDEEGPRAGGGVWGKEILSKVGNRWRWLIPLA